MSNKKPYYLYFANIIKEIEKRNPNLDIKPTNLGKQIAIFDIKDKRYQKYYDKNKCFTQITTSIGVHRGYIIGDITIPVCEYKDGFGSRLIIDPVDDLSLDLEQKGIDTVHIHGGRCPATHVHIELNLNQLKNPYLTMKKLGKLLEKIYTFLGQECPI